MSHHTLKVLIVSDCVRSSCHHGHLGHIFNLILLQQMTE